jgi:flavin-binding protein dodecin
VARPFDTETTTGSGVRLGRKRSAALRDLEGLLADCQGVRDVTASAVEEATARHGVSLDRRCRGVCRELYRRFLKQCLDDQRLTEEERADLAHLKSILSLDAEDVAAVHDQVSKTVYGRAVEEVLEDHRVDPEETEFLHQLRKELELPDGVASGLYEKEERRARHRYFSKTVSTEAALFASHEAVLELTGRSSESVEGAVNDALAEACLAIPEVAHAEISRVRVRVENGRAAEWEVDLKARLDQGRPPD